MRKEKNPEKERERELLREQKYREPQEKKGLLRTMELIDRDGPKFLKAGLLAFLGMLPYLAVLLLAVGGAAPMLLGCIPAGMIAAPQICGVADTVMRSQRDEIGWWWWDTYRKSWKRNFRSCMAPGGIFGLLIGAAVYALYYLTRVESPAAEFWLLMLTALLGMGIWGYYLPMLACMELSFGALIRNCFVLFFNHPIKSLLAAIFPLIYWLLILAWFPMTVFVLLLFSVWLPMLASCQTLYPILDRHFGLKQAYEELQSRKWNS